MQAMTISVNDVEELRKLLYDVTGVDCRYYRFPDGSSNRVTQVPVNDLIDYLDSAGLTYFDWNALNNDAVIGRTDTGSACKEYIEGCIKL